MPKERRAPWRNADEDSRTRLGVVLIDQQPLRRGAAAECAEVLAQLDVVRAGWHRFEREDKPAFARWRAREFGALLSQAREVEVQIREAQALVQEVENEMRRGFQDAHSAYQRVMFRRANPSSAMPSDGEDSRPKNGAARKVTDFEKEALFQEWVQKSLGTNPDKMDDEAYATTFEAFKSHMFRSPLAEARAPNGTRAYQRPRAVIEEEEAQPLPPADGRVKELYRILVRRLHPDLRGDGVAAVSALWHEVQEAYAASDIAQLELLLALSDISESHLGDSTSLAQMRTLHAELQRALCALEKSLSEAEGEDAWNFARSGANDALRLQVKRQLQTDFANRVARLDVLNHAIAEWARGPKANRKVAGYA